MDVRLEKMHLPFAINDAHMKYNNFSKIYYKCTSQIIFPKNWSPPSMSRSSHRRSSLRKAVFRNFAKFTGARLCQSLFFNKVAGVRTLTLLKKRLWHRCFHVNFAKFLRMLLL